MLIVGNHLFIGGWFTSPSNSQKIIDYSISGDTYPVLTNPVFPYYPTIGDINAMAYSGGVLYLVSSQWTAIAFNNLSRVCAYTVATNTFTKVGDLLLGTEPDDEAHAIVISGGYLYVGGNSTYIWKHNIATGGFEKIGTGLQYVRAMALDSYGHIVIAGEFENGNGLSGADYIVRMTIATNQFSVMGGDSAISDEGFLVSGIRALKYVDEILFLGGNIYLDTLYFALGAYFA
jgi:hypothetical protein